MSTLALRAAAASLLLSFATACGDSDADPEGGSGGSAAGGASSAAGGASSAAGGRSTTGGVAASLHGGASGASSPGGGNANGNAPEGVQLGSADTFAILAKTGISTVPSSIVTGNIGISPAAASYVTGFSLIADPATAFSTSLQVVGKVYAADYGAPTPSELTAAVSDMETAFTDAAGRAPDVTELGAGNIGGLTLTPGVYKWGTGLLVPTDITLKGNATAVWIFQVAEDVTVKDGVSVALADGARAKNVFWQVSGQVELGTTAHFEGVVLSKTAIILRTGASINGRLFAQTAVSLDGSTVVAP